MKTAERLRLIGHRLDHLRGSDLPENAVLAMRDLAEVCAGQQREIDELRRAQHRASIADVEVMHRP